MLYFIRDRAGLYNILSFERYLCKQHVNVHCAKLDELKWMYTLQNTSNATLALAILAVTSSSMALM